MIKEENLIFIISQPRSGSSLLQQLIVNTDRVKSVPEPWFMLPLIKTYKETKDQSEYNAHYAHVNFMEYLNGFPDSLLELKKDIRKQSLKLYNLNRLKNGQIYFLDKTPRYYHIIDELKDLFPTAKFIFLVRNPISVFSSILDYNFKGDVFKIFKEDRHHDLFTAPASLISVFKDWNQTDYCLIKYEELIEDSINSFNSVLDYLRLPRISEDLFYEVDEEFQNSRGVDRKGVLKNQRINSDYLNSWKTAIDDSQKKKALLGYLKELGPDMIQQIGYEYKELIELVENHSVKYKFHNDFDYLTKKCTAIGSKMFIKNRIHEWLNRILNL